MGDAPSSRPEVARSADGPVTLVSEKCQCGPESRGCCWCLIKEAMPQFELPQGTPVGWFNQRQGVWIDGFVYLGTTSSAGEVLLWNTDLPGEQWLRVQWDDVKVDLNTHAGLAVAIRWLGEQSVRHFVGCGHTHNGTPFDWHERVEEVLRLWSQGIVVCKDSQLIIARACANMADLSSALTSIGGQIDGSYIE